MDINNDTLLEYVKLSPDFFESIIEILIHGKEIIFK